MTKITNAAITAALQLAGFSTCGRTPGLFLIDGTLPVTPAFLCSVIRRRGQVSWDGGVGLYFQEFEATWNNSLSKDEKRTGFTLPLIMNIANYVELVENHALSFSGDFKEISDNARRIYSLCLKFPCSVEEFDQTLIVHKIVDNCVHNYFHIASYHEDDNIFYRKSVGFIHWFSSRWPEFSKHMQGCLTEYQLRRLKLA